MDLHDGDNLLKTMEAHGFSTAAMDYRLTPEVVHPAHLEDTLAGLEVLAKNHEVESITLVGHSAGACLALQCLQHPKDNYPNAKEMLKKCKYVVGCEGIYDLPALIDEDKSYSGFVEAAFGDQARWTELSPINHPIPGSANLVVVHSTEDELLNEEFQPKIAVERFTGAGKVIRESASGKHNDVPKSAQFSEIVLKYASD
ncbi:hypothetical protein TRVA0_002S05490 [Trichomonascus vanleenenianus]|uniref:arylformamidase n=1 Tax=Trichomonascus vanleenenianus TaxID=2268995 RepID=UPI003EC96A06